ncbi:thiol-disulfide oxidoreductase DCC family protein [Shewanella basaltis]|uniref:thiol-disulfide oxidoreductase DCC family protein n=1 Tax=Shewanella basaltis TaxID=472183 RepID=UPI003AACB061
MELTIFYDGTCPLCLNEMKQLKRHDSLNRIALEDINAADINQRFPDLDVVQANTLLHGLQADGTWLYGLDVTAKAWGLTGKHAWVKLLRLPVIKPVADLAYLAFARNRYRISYLLTGKKRCDTGSCNIK